MQAVTFMRNVTNAILSASLPIIVSANVHAGAVRDGRASVEWLVATTGYTPGKPLQTALRMTLDEGWHTYWINPGEGGMPLSAIFTLPDGWSADEPQHPLPIRFRTGDLHDFGYEGTVIFPITLHPPAGATGEAELAAAFSWLTCDDSACVPGDATLKLRLKPGADSVPDIADVIDATMKQVPVDAAGEWGLAVAEAGDSLDLRLSVPVGTSIDTVRAYPLSVNVVHPGAGFDFKSDGGALTVTVPKSPFAPNPLESLALVIHADGMGHPVIVRWRNDS